MFNYLKVSFVLIMILLVLSCSKSLKINELRVVVSPDFLPFEYIEKDSLKGIDIELVKLIGDKFKIPVKFEMMPFTQMLLSIEQGEYEMAISGITITESRKKHFDFSMPYYSARQVLLSCKNRDIVIDSLEAVIRYKVGVINNSTSQLFLEKSLVKQKRMAANKIIKFREIHNMMDKLSSREVDVVMLEESFAELISEKYNLELIYYSDSDDSYGIIFPKQSIIYDPVNNALGKIIESDEWLKVKERYLLNE